MSLEEITNNGKTVDELGIEMDNLTWRNSLPLFEQFMLRDYIEAYKIKKLGIDAKDYNKYKSISALYVHVELFYGSNNESIREQNTIFDKRLTKEQGCLSYCGCDLETAKRIHASVNEAKKAAVLFEKEIREAYNGDLSTQLGIDKAKYLEEEKNHLAQREAFTSKMKVRSYNPVPNKENN